MGGENSKYQNTKQEEPQLEVNTKHEHCKYDPNLLKTEHSRISEEDINSNIKYKTFKEDKDIKKVWNCTQQNFHIFTENKHENQSFQVIYFKTLSDISSKDNPSIKKYTELNGSKVSLEILKNKKTDNGCNKLKSNLSNTKLERSLCLSSGDLMAIHPSLGKLLNKQNSNLKHLKPSKNKINNSLKEKPLVDYLYYALSKLKSKSSSILMNANQDYHTLQKIDTKWLKAPKIEPIHKRHNYKLQKKNQINELFSKKFRQIENNNNRSRLKSKSICGCLLDSYYQSRNCRNIKNDNKQLIKINHNNSSDKSDLTIQPECSINKNIKESKSLKKPNYDLTSRQLNCLLSILKIFEKRNATKYKKYFNEKSKVKHLDNYDRIISAIHRIIKDKVSIKKMISKKHGKKNSTDECPKIDISDLSAISGNIPFDSCSPRTSNSFIKLSNYLLHSSTKDGNHMNKLKTDTFKYEVENKLMPFKQFTENYTTKKMYENIYLNKNLTSIYVMNEECLNQRSDTKKLKVTECTCTSAVPDSQNIFTGDAPICEKIKTIKQKESRSPRNVTASCSCSSPFNTPVKESECATESSNSSTGDTALLFNSPYSSESCISSPYDDTVKSVEIKMNDFTTSSYESEVPSPVTKNDSPCTCKDKVKKHKSNEIKRLNVDNNNCNCCLCAKQSSHKPSSAKNVCKCTDKLPKDVNIVTNSNPILTSLHSCKCNIKAEDPACLRVPVPNDAPASSSRNKHPCLKKFSDTMEQSESSFEKKSLINSKSSNNLKRQVKSCKCINTDAALFKHKSLKEKSLKNFKEEIQNYIDPRLKTCRFVNETLNNKTEQSDIGPKTNKITNLSGHQPPMETCFTKTDNKDDIQTRLQKCPVSPLGDVQIFVNYDIDSTMTDEVFPKERTQDLKNDGVKNNLHTSITLNKTTEQPGNSRNVFLERQEYSENYKNNVKKIKKLYINSKTNIIVNHSDHQLLMETISTMTDNRVDNQKVLTKNPVLPLGDVEILVNCNTDSTTSIPVFSHEIVENFNTNPVKNYSHCNDTQRYETQNNRIVEIGNAPALHLTQNTMNVVSTQTPKPNIDQDQIKKNTNVQDSACCLTNNCSCCYCNTKHFSTLDYYNKANENIQKPSNETRIFQTKATVSIGNLNILGTQRNKFHDDELSHDGNLSHDSDYFLTLDEFPYHHRDKTNLDSSVTVIKNLVSRIVKSTYVNFEIPEDSLYDKSLNECSVISTDNTNFDKHIVNEPLPIENRNLDEKQQPPIQTLVSSKDIKIDFQNVPPKSLVFTPCDKAQFHESKCECVECKFLIYKDDEMNKELPVDDQHRMDEEYIMDVRQIVEKLKQDGERIVNVKQKIDEEIQVDDQLRVDEEYIINVKQVAEEELEKLKQDGEYMIYKKQNVDEEIQVDNKLRVDEEYIMNVKQVAEEELEKLKQDGEYMIYKKQNVDEEIQVDNKLRQGEPYIVNKKYKVNEEIQVDDQLRGHEQYIMAIEQVVKKLKLDDEQRVDKNTHRQGVPIKSKTDEKQKKFIEHKKQRENRKLAINDVPCVGKIEDKLKVTKNLHYTTKNISSIQLKSVQHKHNVAAGSGTFQNGTDNKMHVNLKSKSTTGHYGKASSSKMENKTFIRHSSYSASSYRTNLIDAKKRSGNATLSGAHQCFKITKFRSYNATYPITIKPIHRRHKCDLYKYVSRCNEC